jgi:hypothetical protein
MTTDPPLACSLSAGESKKRVAEIAAIGADSLLSVSREGVLRFRADEKTRRRLEDVIAAESACCPFLDFDLREDASELTLTIDAPDGAQPLARDIRNAFASAS